MYRPELSKAIMLSVTALALLQPALAQNLNPEETGTFGQVDITQGMAEQSAMHALSTGMVPLPAANTGESLSAGGQSPSSLQGYAAQNNNMAQSQQPAFQGAAQNFNNGQNSNNGQCFNNGQNFNNTQNQQPQGFAPQQCNNNPGGNYQPQSNDLIPGISNQMVGVMGTALLMNYATNGGAANLLGEMRSRGFNNRFRTFGQTCGGAIYH
jgi:hypothetical protein